MNVELARKIIRGLVITIPFMAILTIQGITNIREGHQIVFMLSMIVLFSFLVKNVWVTAFVCWTVYLHCFFKFEGGSVYLSNIFFGTVLYFIVKVGFTKKNIDFFINGILWLVFANIVFMFLQLCNFDFIFVERKLNNGFFFIFENQNPNGLMGQISIMGSFMAMCVPLLATRGNWVARIGAIGLFVPLYLSQASLCVAMGLFGLVFVFHHKVKKWVLIVLPAILIVLAGFYAFRIDKPGQARFIVWKSVLKDAMIHPITGWGLDSFANFNSYKDFRYSAQIENWEFTTDPYGNLYKDLTQIKWWDNPHNLYISLFFEFGFPGLFIFIAYIRQNVLRYQKAIKDPNTMALAGFILVFLGISFAHFPIFLARLACIIIPVFALYETSTS